MLRAEHGWSRGFSTPDKPIPEDLLVLKTTKEKKWNVLIYFSDVLDKNYTSSVQARPEGPLVGVQGHCFPKHMFEHMKNTWTELDVDDQADAGEKRRSQIRAEKQNKQQRQCVEKEKQKAQQDEAAWSARLQDELDNTEVDYEEGPEDQYNSAALADSVEEASVDGDESDDSAKAESLHFK